eukprot:4421321-Alexandrium_andersonii.AAC.1
MGAAWFILSLGGWLPWWDASNLRAFWAGVSALANPRWSRARARDRLRRKFRCHEAEAGGADVLDVAN